MHRFTEMQHRLTEKIHNTHTEAHTRSTPTATHTHNTHGTLSSDTHTTHTTKNRASETRCWSTHTVESLALPAAGGVGVGCAKKYMQKLQRAFVHQVVSAASLSGLHLLHTLLECGMLEERMGEMELIMQKPQNESFEPQFTGARITLSENYRLATAANRTSFGMWAVGKNTYTKTEGIKSISWDLTQCSEIEGLYIAGVIELNELNHSTSSISSSTQLNHTHVLNPNSNAAEHRGFYGWHSDGELVYSNGNFLLNHNGYPNEKVFAKEDDKCTITLDFSTGDLTLTVTDGRQWHIGGLPVDGGERYRVCVDLCMGVCVRMEECRPEYV
eukprot:GDKI01020404.1.p1 GENE.GDKI01020404.1~~GDKI01020404.1.p1  ORF type:complete len:329 (-),score=70.55 GDKI01020404.1:163-1149(-)